MKIKNNSSFSQGEVCGTGRKFASYVLDFLTSVILMVLVFTISESIMNSTAMMKGYRSDIMTSYSSLIAMIEESGISEADEKENLLASSVLQQNYMKGAVLHSLKVNNVDGISEDTYKDVKEVTKKEIVSLYHENSVRILAGCAPCQPFSSYAEDI